MTDTNDDLRDFYANTGLTEKWLRQQVSARSRAPSNARQDRVRWMAKELVGGKLATRKGEWIITTEGRAYRDVTDAFANGDAMPFEDIEDRLYSLIEARGVPPWLSSHYRTWRAIRALLSAEPAVET